MKYLKQNSSYNGESGMHDSSLSKNYEQLRSLCCFLHLHTSSPSSLPRLLPLPCWTSQPFAESLHASSPSLTSHPITCLLLVSYIIRFTLFFPSRLLAIHHLHHTLHLFPRHLHYVHRLQYA